MTQIPSSGTLVEFQNRLASYLPTLAAGLVVLLIGVGVGWLAKRAVIRALVWLRLDRLGGSHSWRAAFAKGDVRSALYNLVGSIVMALVLLLFLDNALQIWGLEVLSRLVDQVLFYLPNLALVLLIAGVGLLLANTLADRVEDTLEEEGVGRARLVAKIFKGALLAVVGALALWQLNFARQIVLSAFLIGFGAIGVAFALAVGVGSSRAIQRAWEALLDKNRDG
jgi:Mechanosensitive ion channel, conserved TM helix